MMTGQLMGTQVCGVVTCTRTPDTAGCSLALPGAGGARWSPARGHPCVLSAGYFCCQGLVEVPDSRERRLRRQLSHNAARPQLQRTPA